MRGHYSLSPEVENPNRYFAAVGRPAEAPNSKHQAPEKFQAQNFQRSGHKRRRFMFDVSLALGCWCLELS
jgi:hypothetical protein